MADVTALVLSVDGEDPSRAIASLGSQTLPPRHIVAVENVRPFHRALNQGAAQVDTEFFVQVDADMTLDRKCLAELRRRAADDVGLVVGPLRDPLLGMTIGVKLYRTACLREGGLRGTISPDTDFVAALARRGWLTIFAVGTPSAPGEEVGLGEHRPEYTASYTYAAYYVLGARHRHRRDHESLLWRYTRLRRSSHPAAAIARAALGHGLFLERRGDLAKANVPNAGLDFLSAFDQRRGGLELTREELLASLGTTPETLAAAIRLGGVLRERGSPESLRHTLGALAGCDPLPSCLAEIGLWHGLLGGDTTPRDLKGVASLFDTS